MEQVRFNYMGREINELSREELLVAIVNVFKESEQWKEKYFKTEEDKITYMGDMIKLKFNK